jgi:hypothetical protein
MLKAIQQRQNKRKSIDINSFEELNEKTFSIMNQKYTKCENEELNVEETLNYLLKNLTIVMRDFNYKNQMTKIFPFIKRSNENDENKEMKKELEVMKEEYFDLLKIKNNGKSEIKEITMKQLNYKTNWRNFLDKIQRQYSPNACIINSDCSFLNDRWINKLEDKIDGLKVDPVEDKIFAIIESSFLHTIDSQVNVEMSIKRSQSRNVIWEKELESNLSEYRYNYMRFALNPEKYAKIDTLEFMLNQLLVNTTDLEICEIVNYISGGNRDLKGTFFSEVEKTFDKFLNLLHGLKIDDLIVKSKKKLNNVEIEQTIEKEFKILKEAFPEYSKDVSTLDDKLKFMKMCLIELDLTNSFIDFFASLTNAICSISNIFQIRSGYMNQKSKNPLNLNLNLNPLNLNLNLHFIDSTSGSSPASPVRKSIFEKETEPLKIIEPHPRLKVETTKINTELVEPTNPMDLGLITSLRSVQIHMKNSGEKGLLYLMNQKDMKMNEFMDNYINITSNLESVIYEILKILPKDSEKHLEEYLKSTRSRSKSSESQGLQSFNFNKK